MKKLLLTPVLICSFVVLTAQGIWELCSAPLAYDFANQVTDVPAKLIIPFHVTNPTAKTQ